MTSQPVDPVDAQLLKLLQEDCSQSLAELGRRIGLSISAVNERLKKLRARGHVRAYVALIDPRAVGYTTCAFVRVAIEGKGNERKFTESALAIREVEECHHVSGDFPFLLKIWARDLAHLERLLADQIKSRPGVLRIETWIVLSSAKDHVTGIGAPAS